MKHQPNAVRTKRNPDLTAEDATAIVPVAKWGRDHWGTLIYAESRCVDYEGKIDNEHMRTNARVHRKLLGDAQLRAQMSGANNPTRLRNGDELDRHDDWSCMEEMVAHGLLEVVKEKDRKRGKPFGGGEVFIRLTDLGFRVAHTIRRDRARGTPTVQWKPLPELEAEIHAGFILAAPETP